MSSSRKMGDGRLIMLCGAVVAGAKIVTAVGAGKVGPAGAHMPVRRRLACC